MTDLSCSYLGCTLRNPLVVSASPITRDLDEVRRAEDAGAAAFVMHSLFEEQIQQDAIDLHHFLDHGSESYSESLSYFPDMDAYNIGPESYLEHLQKIKRTVSVPVFGSLNGTTVGNWIHYARLMQECGADGVELNVYNIATDLNFNAQVVESELFALVRAVRAEIAIPLAIKLSPFFTAPANLVQQLHRAGANAVVLFNRFYQPDFDIDSLEVVHQLKLSHPNELLTRLHWCGLLFGRVPIELAVTGGAHSARDTIKCVMAGANVVMMTSALLRHGVAHFRQVLTEMQHWMEEHEYDSVAQMRGCLSFHRVPNPSAFERGNYMRTLRSNL